MKLICESFSKIIERETNQGTVCGVEVPCTRPNTPMQVSANSNEGILKLKEPLFWIVPACKRMESDKKEFDFRLFSLDNLDEETNSPKEIMLSNRPVNDSNIHKVLSKGSVISGIMTMQIIASKLSFSLNTKINEKLYVKRPVSDFGADEMSMMLS